MPAPVLLFVYNRPDHVKRTVEALQHNTLAAQSNLYVYSDGARDESQQAAVNEVRQFVRTITGFKSVIIIERPKNWGLARSIIDGVSIRVNEAGKVIVLEDDLITAPYFLQFMNDALDLYENEPRVGHIQGCDFTQDPFGSIKAVTGGLQAVYPAAFRVSGNNHVITSDGFFDALNKLPRLFFVFKIAVK